MAEERQATRREFLQTGAKGVAAAVFLSSCSTSPEPAASPPAHPPTNVRTLGRTGLEVPIVGMGTAYAMELVSAALDSGIRYLHTRVQPMPRQVRAGS